MRGRHERQPRSHGLTKSPSTWYFETSSRSFVSSSSDSSRVRLFSMFCGGEVSAAVRERSNPPHCHSTRRFGENRLRCRVANAIDVAGGRFVSTAGASKRQKKVRT